MKRTFFACLAAMMLSASANARESHLSELYPNTFNLHEVTLLDGQFRHAMETNIATLKAYDVDRLLAPFLTEAGLEARKPRFENWAGLDGHVGGHYLSALAIHYSATGDEELLKTMDYMLDEMERAQKANGDGYVGGVPESKKCWADLRKGDVRAISSRWVPWYNMHKVYAGLRDAYIYAGSEKAKGMFLALCDWGVEVISHLDNQQMERMLDTEFGGMNEVYADAYALTGEMKYLDAAIRFSHHWLLDSMAKGVDNLDNRHANTQVPKVVGYQRVAEMCVKAGRMAEAKTFYDAANFFWSTVVYNRSLAIGGNSRREYFPTAADCVSYTEEREGPESCNTNNMLKLTEGLFRMAEASMMANGLSDGKYSDFFERAMFNHILSTQHPEHGGYVYFTSARPGHYRVYSQPNSAMWCCVGTGMENHGKYGQFIYTHTADTLAVNLFVASKLNWGDVTVTQNTAFPNEEGTRLTINTKKAANFTLKIRKPFWCDFMNVKINGEYAKAKALKNGYVSFSREWKDGDVVEIALPMEYCFEEMPNVPNYVAIMRGPVVLGAKVSTEDLKGLKADDGRWGHIASGKLIPTSEMPALIGNREEILAKLRQLKPAADGKIKVDGLVEGRSITLEPFAGIHDARYMMYWLTMTPEEFAARQAEIKAREAEMLRIDALTIDAVNFGEQQPEADHRMKQEGSQSGNYQGQSYRHAEGGWFSCELDTKGLQNLSLMAKYWGNETGGRKFDILIDGKLLKSCDNAGLTGKSEFVDVTYQIPDEMLKGKNIITVMFKAKPGSIAGGVYHLRLLKN